MTDLDIPPIRKGPLTQADAVEPITADLATHDMRDPVDIGFNLAALAQGGAAVSVYAAGAAAVLARIESVDTERRTFLFELAGGAVLAPGHAVFVAPLDGSARLQFELDHDWTGEPGFAAHVQAPFPAVCRVLNRRADERLAPTLGDQYRATFSMFRSTYELPLCDFSGAGVGLRATPDQALDLYVGKTLENVHLELGPSFAVDADLEIRLLRPCRTSRQEQQIQVGCLIANISAPMRASLERAVAEARQRP